MMRFPRWLLARLAPEAWQESIAGDLEEERHRRLADGRYAGVMWLTWATVVTVAKLRAADRRDETREQPQRLGQLDTVAREWRQAVRALYKSPGFTVVALVVLALGVGASTAIFSVVDAVVLRPMPFDQPDRLVAVGGMNRTAATPYVGGTTAPDYFDWAAQQHVFQSIGAAAIGRGFVIRDGTRPEELRAWQCTASLFDVLRVHPQIGRLFTKEEETPGAEHVAIISNGLWRRRYGGTPAIIGQSIRFDTGAWRIIGVMPPGFDYPVGLDRPADLWVPYAATAANDKSRAAGRNYYLRVVARLKDHVSIAQARAEMAGITARLAARYPRWFADRVSVVESLQDATVGRVRARMILLLGAVAFVLVIACVNVANLLMARALTKGRELWVRAALGASRGQIARGVLLESLVLSTAGAACGLVVASPLVQVLCASIPPGLPRIADVAINLRVLGVTALVAIGTGVFFGLVPALRCSHPMLTAALGDGSRSVTGGRESKSLRSALVVAEVSLAAVLLVGAGLFVASFSRLVRVDLGIDYSNVLTVEVSPRLDNDDKRIWDDARDRTPQLVDDITGRIRAIPGVVAISAIDGGAPLSGGSETNTLTIPGRPPFSADADQVYLHFVTSEYAQVVRLPIRRGRFIRTTDSKTSPKVVVLSEESASRFFGGQDPIGTVVDLADDKRLVVGIVGSTRHDGPEGRLNPEAYLPFAQTNSIGATIMIRTAVDPTLLAPAVRDAVQTSLPDVPVLDPTTLERSRESLVATREFNMLLISLFGALALTIAAVGIYGVIAFDVAQQTREISLRLALGAQPVGVRRAVIRRVLVLVASGTMIGLVGAWTLSNLLNKFLFHVTPHDPIVYAAVAAVLVASGLGAAWLPARLAAHVDPIAALRS